MRLTRLEWHNVSKFFPENERSAIRGQSHRKQPQRIRDPRNILVRPDGPPVELEQFDFSGSVVIVLTPEQEKRVREVARQHPGIIRSDIGEPT